MISVVERVGSRLTALMMIFFYFIPKPQANTAKVLLGGNSEASIPAYAFFIVIAQSKSTEMAQTCKIRSNVHMYGDIYIIYILTFMNMLR